VTSYDDWARTFHGHAFLQRSAERNAAFLLPSLRAGQRVLDVGCGPGAITRGLAERVAPDGEVVGVDHDAAYVAAARERWSSVPGLRFEEADAAALPFEDGSFDVAFLHAVLQHVTSPEAVVAEVRRVVRSGGVVGIADADLDGFLLHPQSDGLRAATALDRRTRRNPDVGRRLPELLLGAGFAEVQFLTSTNVVCGADAARGMAESSARRLEATPFVERARAQGWLADDDDPSELSAAWRTWAASPGAVFVTFWCQALAS
jgi:SAM-dependent methyltransferase